jgi:ubiquinone/menaquinone biosynthesis C-methylase UbiE
MRAILGRPKHDARAHHDWHVAAPAYSRLIKDNHFDSHYLRNAGLIPNLIELIGDCRNASLLDVGTGTGWLFDMVHPRSASACDLVRPENLPANVEFRDDDASSLSFPSGSFDKIVASLLLLYCKDLDEVCREFRRVAKSDGAELVVSIMHPYFYRTGRVTEDGAFVVERDLSKKASFDFKIANAVGPFEYTYRPLPDYVNTLIRSGWDILEMRDWFVDLDDYRRIAGARAVNHLPRTGNVPMFTFIKCRASKPAKAGSFRQR